MGENVQHSTLSYVPLGECRRTNAAEWMRLNLCDVLLNNCLLLKRICSQSFVHVHGYLINFITSVTFQLFYPKHPVSLLYFCNHHKPDSTDTCSLFTTALVLKKQNYSIASFGKKIFINSLHKHHLYLSTYSQYGNRTRVHLMYRLPREIKRLYSFTFLHLYLDVHVNQTYVFVHVQPSAFTQCAQSFISDLDKINCRA